jgi:hypothetical protein
LVEGFDTFQNVADVVFTFKVGERSFGDALAIEVAEIVVIDGNFALGELSVMEFTDDEELADSEVRNGVMDLLKVSADGGEQGIASVALNFDSDKGIFFVSADKSFAEVLGEDSSAALEHGFVNHCVIANNETGDNAAG